MKNKLSHQIILFRVLHGHLCFLHSEASVFKLVVMPKRLNSIWEHATILEKVGKGSGVCSWRCKYCATIFKSSTTRLRIHTKIRNKLTTKQLERLVYCRENLRILEKWGKLTQAKQVNPDEVDIFKVPNDVPIMSEEERDIYLTLYNECANSDLRRTRSNGQLSPAPNTFLAEHDDLDGSSDENEDSVEDEPVLEEEHTDVDDYDEDLDAYDDSDAEVEDEGNENADPSEDEGGDTEILENEA